MTNSTQEKFEVYKLRMQQQLSDLDDQIQKLKAKAASAKEEQKQNYQESVAELERKREAMQEKLSELGSSSADAYETLKAGVESAWSELSSAFDKAKKSF